MRSTDTLTLAKTTAVLQATGLSRLKTRLAILGAGRLAEEVCQALNGKAISRYQVVGVIKDSRGRASAGNYKLSVIGTYENLFPLVEQYNVHAIAVCEEDRRAVLPVQTLLDFKAMGIEVIDGHHLIEEASGRLSIDSLRPSALVFSTGFKQRQLSKIVKRLCDFSIALVGLICLSPLFCAVAVLIKTDSAGPVFYRQMRVGLRGKPFMIWKFRSMRKDAETGGARWADVNDPRVSRVGRWLRTLRIDEIPQLINVLRGDMSLVGPRPERPVFVQELRSIIPYYDLRHTVRPGITGWAQVRYKYAASQEDAHKKLQYDLYYVKNLSFLLDLKILIRTVRVVLLGEGAH